LVPLEVFLDLTRRSTGTGFWMISDAASVNIVFIKKIPLWSKTMLIRHCQGTNAVFVYYPRGLKALKFDNFENLHNSFLWPEYFIDYFCEKGFLVRLWHPCVYFPPKDSTLHYKKCVHLWNNFPCISTLVTAMF